MLVEPGRHAQSQQQPELAAMLLQCRGRRRRFCAAARIGRRVGGHHSLGGRCGNEGAELSQRMRQPHRVTLLLCAPHLHQNSRWWPSHKRHPPYLLRWMASKKLFSCSSAPPPLPPARADGRAHTCQIGSPKPVHPMQRASSSTEAPQMRSHHCRFGASWMCCNHRQVQICPAA